MKIFLNHFGLSHDDVDDMLGDEMDISVDLLFAMRPYERVNQLVEKYDLLRIDSVDQCPLTEADEKSAPRIKHIITPLRGFALFKSNYVKDSTHQHV